MRYQLIALPKLACIDLVNRLRGNVTVYMPISNEWEHLSTHMLELFKFKGWSIEIIDHDDAFMSIFKAYARARRNLRENTRILIPTDRTDWMLGSIPLLGPATHTHTWTYKSKIYENLARAYHVEQNLLNYVSNVDMELLRLLAPIQIPLLPMELLDRLLMLIVDEELPDDEIARTLNVDVDVVRSIRMSIYYSSCSRYFATSLENYVTY